MTPIVDARQQLARMLSEQAVVINSVDSRASKHTSYYIDARRVTFSGDGAVLVGAEMLRLIQTYAPQIKVIGGMESGAAAVIIATLAVSAGVDSSGGMRGFLVRTKPKPGQGRWRWIDGVRQRCSSVVLEDVTTSGLSIMKVIDRVRADGIAVVAAISLVDREEGARSLIQSVCPFYAAYTAAELLDLRNARENSGV